MASLALIVETYTRRVRVDSMILRERPTTACMIGWLWPSSPQPCASPSACMPVLMSLAMGDASVVACNNNAAAAAVGNIRAGLDVNICAGVWPPLRCVCDPVLLLWCLVLDQACTPCLLAATSPALPRTRMGWPEGMKRLGN